MDVTIIKITETITRSSEHPSLTVFIFIKYDYLY